MLKIHKPNHKLLIISITSILSIGTLLGFSALTYTPELSHAEVIDTIDRRTIDDITYMQEITPEICQNSELDKQYTLTDIRDGSTYTVARIKNQTNEEINCWMTQNLRLTNHKLTSADSDVTKDFDLPASTVLSSTDNPKQFTTNDQYESKVYYADDTTNGAYYNWYTATAGTGDASFAMDNASNSICPKGWRLPTGGNNTGEFYELLHNITAAQGMSTPYTLIHSGWINKSVLQAVNAQGYYWSSTTYDKRALIIYYLPISTGISLVNTNYSYFGQSIRCLARTEHMPNNNIEIAIKNTVSLDLASEVEIEKGNTSPSAADLNVKVASNQLYSVSINAKDSAELTSTTSNVTIPSNGGSLTTAVNNWGIMKPNESTYAKVTTSPELFYQATAPEVKDILFKIGISTAPDLPNGEYSTDITVTAVQN